MADRVRLAMSETADILRKAKALVEKGWCRGCYAKAANGARRGRWDDDATKFCMLGALFRAVGPDSYAGFELVADILLRQTGGFRLDTFNDQQRNKRPILAAFDRAIAAEKA